MRMQGPKKLIELEALRGLAAVVVLFHHFMLGFTPRLHGMFYADQPYSLFGTPAFAFVNGSAAVIVFFVLSGFVLTVGIFKSQRAAGVFVAALKRWPRLALTVMAANALAGLLMAHRFSATPTLPPLSRRHGWAGSTTGKAPATMKFLFPLSRARRLFLRARAGTTATFGRCITNSGAA